MSMQKECKEHRYFWFIDQVREYILALEEDQDTSPPSEGRKKSVLNAAQTPSGDSSSTDDLRKVISKLAASVAAITTKAETAFRVKNNKWGNDRPYDAKMGPCRFCGGGHAQASRLPHPEDSLSKATYPSTCRSSERST